MPVVEYSRTKRRYVITVRLDPFQAEDIADALGANDTAGKELRDAAAECRKLNGEGS